MIQQKRKKDSGLPNLQKFTDYLKCKPCPQQALFLIAALIGKPRFDGVCERHEKPKVLI